MKKLIICWLILVSSAVYAYGVTLLRDGNGWYLYNDTEYYMVCILNVQGRKAYWELYPYDRTPSYNNINGWDCR